MHTENLRQVGNSTDKKHKVVAVEAGLGNISKMALLSDQSNTTLSIIVRPHTRIIQNIYVWTSHLRVFMLGFTFKGTAHNIQERISSAPTPFCPLNPFTDFCCWWWWWCSVAQSCLTPCDSMDYSILSFPVLHHLLESVQIHVH